MTFAFVTRLLVLVLASLLGSEVTRRVGVERRGPVGRITMAMTGVLAAAAVIAAGRTETRFGWTLGFLAVTLAMVHLVGALLLARRSGNE